MNPECQVQVSKPLLVLLILAVHFVATLAIAQESLSQSAEISSAKTIYFKNQTGSAAVGVNALAALKKWSRFRIVQDQKQADLILLLSLEPYQGPDSASRQTGDLDNGDVSNIPNWDRQKPTRYAYLTLIDPKSGESLWDGFRVWGGLLTGFDSVGERLVAEFEKQTQLAEQGSSLKVIKDVPPTYPPEASKKQIEGTVVVRIVVDMSGTVIDAQALSGPPELFQSSVEAAKQVQFEPPQHPPVTTEWDVTYSLEPKPCPPGKKGEHAEVLFAHKFPMKSDIEGKLRIVGDIYDPLPPYPKEAAAAGKEGNLEMFITVAPGGEVIGVLVTKSVDPDIDEAAVATVRTWKFKVTRGEEAAFPFEFLYRMTCFSADDN
jgi:TonB family protein